MNAEPINAGVLNTSLFGQYEPEQLQALAQEHDEVLRAGSKRLRKFEQLLAAGNLQEAVACAEASPRLPDLLTRLYGAYFPVWKNLLAAHALPAPHEASVKSIAKLHEFYTRKDILDFVRAVPSEQDVRDAIARARWVIRAGTGDPGDRDALLALEKARLQTLGARFNDPTLTGVEATELIQEVTNTEWQLPPAPQFVQRATEIHRRLCHATRLGSAQVLTERLQSATQDRDAARAQLALNAFRAITKDWNIQLPTDCQAAVDAAQQFCEQKRAGFQRAVTALESILDAEGSAHAVNTQLEQMFHSGHQLPASLHQRVQAHLKRLELKKQRGKSFGQWVRVAIVLLMLGGGALAVRFLARAGDGKTVLASSTSNESQLTKARAALPNLSEYARILRESPIAEEGEAVSRWAPALPAYETTLRLCERLLPLAKDRGRTVSFMDWQNALGSAFSEYSSTNPYRSLMQHYALRATLSQGTDYTTNLESLLTGDVFKKLRVFHETDASGRVIATYYTQEGCQFEAVSESTVQIQVMLDDSSASKMKTFPKTSVSAIQVPTFVAACSDILNLLKTEREAPNWIPGISEFFGRLVEAREMEPYIRTMLLDQVLTLDGLYFNQLQVPESDRTQIRTLAREQVEFWLTGSKSVREATTRIRAKLGELQPALNAALAQANEETKRQRAALPMLLRPLALSATAEIDVKQQRSAKFLADESTLNELWVVTQQGVDSYFEIAAVRGDDSKWIWIDGVSVAAGQPLLSPKDGVNTSTLWQGSGRPADPFPRNLAAAQTARKGAQAH